MNLKFNKFSLEESEKLFLDQAYRKDQSTLMKTGSVAVTVHDQ